MHVDFTPEVTFSDCQAALKALSNDLVGTTVLDWGCRLKTSGIILSYCGQMLPHDEYQKVFIVNPEMTDKAMSESLAKMASVSHQAQAANIDWQSIMQIVLSLLLRWLNPTTPPSQLSLKAHGFMPARLLEPHFMTPTAGKESPMKCTATQKTAFAQCVSTADADTCVKCCEATALPPGTLLAFLQKLVANSPQLLAEFMTILALFTKAPIVPPVPPTPAP